MINRHLLDIINSYSDTKIPYQCELNDKTKYINMRLNWDNIWYSGYYRNKYDGWMICRNTLDELD